MNKTTLLAALAAHNSHSAWGRAVIGYAMDAVEYIEKDTIASVSDVLNGATDARAYSEGGCALIYDYDIAERVCTPSEYKRKKEGELPPNSQESWLEVQTRALTQAFGLIGRIMRRDEKMRDAIATSVRTSTAIEKG